MAALSAFFRTWLGRKVSTEMGADLDLLAGLGIAAHAGLLVPNDEVAEILLIFDLLAALQRFLDGVKHHLDDLGGLLLGEAHLLVNALDDVGLGHGLAPRRDRLSPDFVS